jgi:hypothetical protein
VEIAALPVQVVLQELLVAQVPQELVLYLLFITQQILVE